MGDRNWRDKAACAGQPELFDVPKISGPKASYFRKAKEICDRCPVIHECRESATPEDHAYTYRGGILPLSLIHRKKSEVVAGVMVCPEGHVGNFMERNDGRPAECRTCRNKRDNVRYHKRKAGYKFEAKPTESRGIQCKFGHDDWRSILRPRTGRTEWYCVPCKKDRSKRAYEDARDARIGT